MKKNLTKKLHKLTLGVLLILALNFSLTHAQIITTVAGTGVAGGTGDGGPAIAARLSFPTAVCVDGSGNIYIADQLNNKVRMVNTSGVITTIAGTGVSGYSGDGGPATSAQLNWPIGVFADGLGNIYIGENTGHRVRKVNSSGIITTVAGDGTAGYSGDGGPATSARLYSPAGLFVDGSGNLYIGDWHNHAIRMVNTSGIISTVAGNGTMGYSGDGGPATSAQLHSTFSLYVDAPGNIYLCDVENHCIRKVNTSGIISTIAGNGTVGFSGDGAAATSAQLNWPYGVWVDGSDNILIGDYRNNRVRKVDAVTGIITTIAGTGAPTYTGDGGPAIAASIYNPSGIYVDGSGSIFIADQGNNCVRKIAGTIANTLNTSVTGSPFCPCASINISYNGTGTFNSGNNFNAELSDETGSFTSPTIIGSLQSNAVSGTIPATIPCNAVSGAAYRIRVVSSNPTVTGTNNGTDITISTSVNAGTITAVQDTICSGGTAVLAVTGSSGNIQWQDSTASVNFTDIPGVTSSGYTSSPAQTVFYRVKVANGGCSAISAIKEITVNPVSVAGTITALRDTICDGSPGFLTVNGNSGSVQWQHSLMQSQFADISGATGSPHITTQGGYYRVYTSTHICSDTSAAFHLVVKPSPVAVFNYSGTGNQLNFSSAGSSGNITVYEWNFGDSTTSAEQHPSHTYTSYGQKHVCLTVYNGSNCSFTICKDVTIIPTGMAYIPNDYNQKIYPNPFTDFLFIRIENLNAPIESIEVYDLLGRNIYHQQLQISNLKPQAIINLSGLLQGMYFLKIKTGNSEHIQPIIKQ